MSARQIWAAFGTHQAQLNSLKTQLDTIGQNLAVQTQALQQSLLTSAQERGSFQSLFSPGQSTPNALKISVGTSLTQISASSRQAKRGFFQNQSTTDLISIYLTSAPTFAIAQLGVASSNIGGGSFSFGNVDIGQFQAKSSTNANQVLTVYYEA